MSEGSKKLARRHFLRGAAGFTLALPFLPSLAARGEAQAGPKKRLVAFMSTEGQFEENWFPTVTPETRIADHVHTMPLREIPGPISRVVGPEFDPYREKLTLLTGLDGLTAGHNLTMPLMAASVGWTDSEYTYARTIDTVLEDSTKFYPTPVPEPVLRLTPGLSGRAPARTNSICWRDGAAIPAMWDSRVVFNKLFGAASGDPIPEGVDPTSRRTLLIDHVKPSYDRLQSNSRLGRDDRQRLDQFITMLTEVQQRIAAAPVIDCDGPLQRSEVIHEDAYSNHIDMMVAALACGITRVSAFYCQHHASDGVDHGLHGLSHSDDSASHLMLNRWIAARYAEIVAKLDSVEEADGTTLLDNSIAFWGGGIGICNNNGHYCFRYPLLAAGGLQGTFRTGEYIDYRSRPRIRWAGHEHLGRPYNQFLTSIMHGMGLDPEDWEAGGEQGFGLYHDLDSRYYDQENSGAYARTFANRREYLPYFYNGA